jgi:hypothetical protein
METGSLYPLAGSFVGYLLKTYGAPAVAAFFRGTAGDGVPVGVPDCQVLLLRLRVDEHDSTDLVGVEVRGLRRPVREADGQAQHAAALAQLDEFSRDARELGLNRLRPDRSRCEEHGGKEDCEAVFMVCVSLFRCSRISCT